MWRSTMRFQICSLGNAFLKGKQLVLNGNFYLRNASSAASVTAHVNRSTPERSVFISQSNDIFTNLALEDWLYRHADFQNHRVLLLWQNDPTLVIGRHQNIWTEVDLDEAERKQVQVARRNSGGGAVYHDKGNLNCSFFTPRNDYNRRYNLTIIQKALRKLGLLIDINCKDDLILDEGKVSGTASKLGKSAYHHCTLLVDSDLKTLSGLLNPVTDGFVSKATKSKKSSVTNLKAYRHDINVKQVLRFIGDEFLRTDTNGDHHDDAFAAKQRGYQLLNPTDEWFPGLNEIMAHFNGWEWTYGKTPDFTVTKSVQFFNGLGANEVQLKVVKGLVQSPSITFPTGTSASTQNEFLNFISEFVDAKPFSPQLLHSVGFWKLPESYRSYQ